MEISIRFKNKTLKTHSTKTPDDYHIGEQRRGDSVKNN